MIAIKQYSKRKNNGPKSCTVIFPNHTMKILFKTFGCLKLQYFCNRSELRLFVSIHLHKTDCHKLTSTLY